MNKAPRRVGRPRKFGKDMMASKTFDIPVKWNEAIKYIAKSEGKSEAEIMRTGVREYLQRKSLA
jgi:hypothetical protein